MGERCECGASKPCFDGPDTCFEMKPGDPWTKCMEEAGHVGPHREGAETWHTPHRKQTPMTLLPRKQPTPKPRDPVRDATPEQIKRAALRAARLQELGRMARGRMTRMTREE